MAGDKTILGLPNGTPVLTDTSVFADVSGTFGYTFMQLLSLLQANIGAGAVITFGNTIPSNTAGNDGDLYVKTTTGQFAQKLSGAWTVVYTVPAGVVGNVIKYGTPNPNGSVSGTAGDLFIDTASAVFYESTGGTAWTAQFSMATGPAGATGATGAAGANGTNGNTVLNGTANPINTQGNNGDFFINTNTNIIFGPKAAGAWPGTGTSLIGNIPFPVKLDYAKGSANPIIISNWQGAYAAVYGNLASIVVETLNNTCIGTLNTLVPGSGGTNGVYNNVPLTGGTGALATANITIAGGVVTVVTMVNPGTGYTAGDTLSASVGSITGFSIKVLALGKSYNTSSTPATKVMDATGALIEYFFIDDPDPSNAALTADNLRITIKI